MKVPSLVRIARRSPNLWFGAFFLFAAAALFAGGVGEWEKGKRVRTEGVRAQATVLSKSIDPARREGNPRTRYLVTVRFSAGDTPVERTDEVAVEEWEALGEGGTTLVTYLPSDPETAAAARPADAWVGLILGGLGVILGSIGTLLAVPAVRRIRLVRRLYREGETTEGTVLEVSPTGTVIHRVRQWRLRYEFRDRLGKVERGESDLLPPQQATRWKPGDVGAVRYDPLHPQASVWVSEPEEASPFSEHVAAGRRRSRPLKLLVNAGVGVVLAFVCAVLAEIPPIKLLVDLADEHRSTLLVPTIAVLTVGFVLFMGGVLSLVFEQGAPMSYADVEDHVRSVRLAARPVAWRASRFRLRGKGAGASGEDRFTFRELKDAWRSGRLLRDRVWRRRLVTVVGGFAMSFGLLGLFVAIGPPWVKVLFAALTIFLLVSISRGFLKA
jgi:hypothetical protein